MASEPPAFMRPRILRSDAGEISYLENGAGPVLLLLHGIGSGARSWRNQLATLADRFRVIAWDAPGYGSSQSLAPATPDAGDYARALAAFLAALGIVRCHLLGHSLGSLMAARFAAEWPGRLASLTLASIASGHAALPDAERERLRRGRLDDLQALGPRGMAEKRGPKLLSPNATDAMRQAVIDTMSAISPDGYAQAVRMLSLADTRADIARLPSELPLQILFGERDEITTPEQNLRCASAQPRAPVYVVPEAGHAVYIEQPQAFNELVARFVAACRAQEGASL